MSEAELASDIDRRTEENKAEAAAATAATENEPEGFIDINRTVVGSPIGGVVSSTVGAGVQIA